MGKLKIGMIASVNTSKEVKDDKGVVTKKARTYATLVSGAVVFGKQGLEFKQGEYMIYDETFQTQDAEGNDIEPKPINVATSVWATKAKAIEAIAEDQLTDAEVNAYVKQATKKLEQTYSIDEMVENA